MILDREKSLSINFKGKDLFVVGLRMDEAELFDLPVLDAADLFISLIEELFLSGIVLYLYATVEGVVEEGGFLTLFFDEDEAIECVIVIKRVWVRLRDEVSIAVVIVGRLSV